MEATLPPSSLLARSASYRDGCTSTWRLSPLYSAEQSSEGQSSSVRASSSSPTKRTGNPRPRDRSPVTGARNTRSARSPPSRDGYRGGKPSKIAPDQDARVSPAKPSRSRNVGSSLASPDRTTRTCTRGDTRARENKVSRTCGGLPHFHDIIAVRQRPIDPLLIAVVAVERLVAAPSSSSPGASASPPMLSAPAPALPSMRSSSSSMLSCHSQQPPELIRGVGAVVCTGSDRSAMSSDCGWRGSPPENILRPRS